MSPSILLLACSIVPALGLPGTPCTKEAECDAGECCQIMSKYLVYSRRQATEDGEGTCQKYKLEGDPCSGMEKRNGYCSCAPGLYCQEYKVPKVTSTNGKRRSMRYDPDYYWVYECAQQAK